MLEMAFRIAVPTGAEVSDVLGRKLGFLYYDWKLLDETRGFALVEFSAGRDVLAEIVRRLRAA